MIYEIVVKETALKDLVNAVKYYESKQVSLGESFLNCWEQTLTDLQQAPQNYQKKHKNFRQVLIKPFPYHIIYEIEGGVIVVYKVPHAARHHRKRYKKK